MTWDTDAMMNNPFISALIGAGLLILVEEPGFPQQNRQYFYLDSWGKIDHDIFLNKDRDLWRKASGNIFKTREEAEAYKADLLSK